MDSNIQKIVAFIASSMSEFNVLEDNTCVYGIKQYGRDIVGNRKPALLLAVEYLYNNNVRELELSEHVMVIDKAHDGNGNVTDNLYCSLKPLSKFSIPADLVGIIG
jgi:hypothetical protein